jgi:multiple sugar transport system substrate-binding protein
MYQLRGRRKMKKWVTVSTIGALSAAIVLGSGLGVKTASADGQVNLKLGMWSSSPAEKQLVQNQLNAFEKKYPNIHVDIQVINGDYMQALQPMLASNTAPDIFYVDSSVAPQLESAGSLMPLDSYIKSNNVDVKDFSPALLKAFQWKGQTYGLPKDFNTMAIEYNKTLFKKAGIKTPPKTWDEFVKDAAIFKKKGIAPLSMPIDVARYYPFIADFGGSYYDAANDKATFTNPKNEAGLKFFMDNLIKKNIVTPKDQGATWPGEAFARGKVAMAAEGAWIIPFLKQSAPKLQYGVSDFPSEKGKNFNMVFTVCYAMNKNTDHPDEAAKLLFYMTGKEAQKMTADSGLAIPARQSQQGEFVKKYPNYKAFVNGVKNAIPYEFGTLGQNFVDAINKATEAGVLKKLSPKEVLKQADQTLQSQLDQ